VGAKQGRCSVHYLRRHLKPGKIDRQLRVSR
jgi:hypothetical protein